MLSPMTRLRLALVALVAAVCFGPGPALAVNLGDVPANDYLGASCPKLEFLGPLVTAECFDKDQLVITSQIDVRACAGYALVLDRAARIRCRARARR
jgi:hypothetical protein